nr:VPg [Caladenia virus A]
AKDKSKLKTRRGHIRSGALFGDEEDQGEFHTTRWVGSEKDIVDEFGESYSRKNRGKRREQPSEFKSLWDVRAPRLHQFRTLYNTDVSKYKHVIIDIPNCEITKRLEYGDVDNLQAVVQSLVSQKRAELNKPDLQLPKEITLVLANSAGPGQKITLTPHDPFVQSRTTGQPSGYPEFEGEFRQTRHAQIITEEEAEKYKQRIEYQ